MREIHVPADKLVTSLVRVPNVAILDSCGVGHLGSRFMIGGIDPLETLRLDSDDVTESLDRLRTELDRGFAAIFTISYDFGARLQGIATRHSKESNEPDIYLALFDSLIVHDYQSGRTFMTGDSDIAGLENKTAVEFVYENGAAKYSSNFSRPDYLKAIGEIQELIRSGYTYQTNLTQQLTVPLREGDDAGQLFMRLRRDNPAPFAAFIDRGESKVVSASPERFFKIVDGTISTSPIKGTRRRGVDDIEDALLRNELLTSEKDRAENTMIVDLLRNDLGHVCEYGSVHVKKLCDLEEHPTLFHLVSTIEGMLRPDANFADILRALFPCGSITGAPKVSTMKIIDDLEPTARGLSMGAIGYYIPKTGFAPVEPCFDISVAIRTMVVRDNIATFNVGGGITIDSYPDAEYDESLLKAKALLSAIGNK
jgi:para-aminobenzoate synthetase component 1